MGHNMDRGTRYAVNGTGEQADWGQLDRGQGVRWTGVRWTGRQRLNFYLRWTVGHGTKNIVTRGQGDKSHLSDR